MSLRVPILLLISPVAALGADAPIRVTVFQGTGVGPISEELIAALKSAEDGRFQILRITAEEIRGGKLSDVDVLIHPGGSGSKQGRALADSGGCRLAGRREIVICAEADGRVEHTNLDA